MPRYLPVQHNLFTVVIDFNDRITPTQIRIQMIEPDRALDRDDAGAKPCRSDERQRRRPPERNSLRYFQTYGQGSCQAADLFKKYANQKDCRRMVALFFETVDEAKVPSYRQTPK